MIILVISIGFIIVSIIFEVCCVKDEDNKKVLGKSFEAEILVEINEKRQNYGVKPLIGNKLLNTSAMAKAQAMTKAGEFAHSWKEHEDAFKEVRVINKNKNWKVIGENLALCFIGAENVVEGWMKSEGHKENLLNTRFSEMGIGVSNFIKMNGKICLNIVLHLGG